MFRATLNQVALDVGADLPEGAAELRIEGVGTDTRQLPQGCLFVALSGENFDGSAFVAQAFDRGAKAAIVSNDATLPDDLPGPVLRVRDTARALGDLARAYRRRCNFQVIGITGSAGKTTTKELTRALLARRVRVEAAPKSFNNHIGVPLTILSADESTEVLVLEMGTSGPGELHRLGSIARPDVVAITCVGPSHLEELGSLEGVAREKLSLLEHVRAGGAAVLNVDDPRLRRGAKLFAARRGAQALIEVSVEGREGAWSGTHDPETAQLTVQRPDASDATGPTVELGAPGRSHAVDALLALALAEYVGQRFEADETLNLRGVGASGRMTRHEVDGVVVLDDTYNANPVSVGAALDTLSQMTPPERRVVVLGTMAELGSDAERWHREVGARLGRLGVKHLITVGDTARAFGLGAAQAGLPIHAFTACETAAEAAVLARTHARAGDVVLFKGSRVCALETAVQALLAALEAAESVAA